MGNDDLLLFSDPDKIEDGVLLANPWPCSGDELEKNICELWIDKLFSTDERFVELDVDIVESVDVNEDLKFKWHSTIAFACPIIFKSIIKSIKI